MMISYLKIKLERKIESVRGGYTKLSPCCREMYALDFWRYGMIWKSKIMILIVLRDIIALASVSQLVGCHPMHQKGALILSQRCIYSF